MRAVAWYTCKEFLRKKVMYAAVFIAFVLLFGSIIAGQLALSEQTKIVQDIGLNIIEICGLIMSLFFGASLIAQEIAQGTIFLLLSKNIKRSSILVGKYIGFAAILVLMRLILSLAFGGITALYHIAWSSAYVYTLVGILFSWLLTLAVVMFFSVFVSPFVALFAALVVYLLGHMMSFVVYYVTVAKSDAFSPLFASLVKGIYYLIPNYTSLSLQEFIGVPLFAGDISAHFLTSIAVSAVYIVLLLTLGSVIFRKKEL